MCFVTVDVLIPDFPPPSFQEAITTPVYRMQGIAMSDTSFSSYYSIQRSPSVDSYPTTSGSSPVSHYEDAYEQDTADIVHSPPAFLTQDSYGAVGRSPAEWEVELQQGISLEERVRRERERQEQGKNLSVEPPRSTSEAEACSHCGVAPKSPADNQRRAETIPRRRGLLRHRHSQSFSSASVPSTPIRSRPRTSLKSTSSSKRKSRSMSPRPPPMSTSNSLTLMSRKLFPHSNKGKDKPSAEEPLNSGWEVVTTDNLPVPEVGNLQPQPPTSRVRRTLSRMSPSALAAINTQADAGRNGSIKPYPLEPPLPSATTEKLRLKQSDPPVSTQNAPPSLQHDQPPQIHTPPPVRISSPLTTTTFSPQIDLPPPTPSMSVAVTTPGIGPTRPALVDPRQTSPLISPVAARPGVRQRVKSMSVHTGPPSSIAFPKVPLPADRRAATNSNLRKYASMKADPSSKLSMLNSFPDVPPIMGHLRKPTQSRELHISLSTVRAPSSPLVSSLEPPTPTKHHYPGRPLPAPPAGIPPSPSAYETLFFPRSATASRVPLSLNVAIGMTDTMVTEGSTATSSGLTYITDRPMSPLSSVSGSSIIETISEADYETPYVGSLDLDILISPIDSSGGDTYQVGLTQSQDSRFCRITRCAGVTLSF